uniref:WRKY19-like zinc finger domain-containing protein n=1 Tax=Peronospora matthiolae TaxID=2874970 RepID=A0AAV1UFZ0_9STRA
MSFSERRLEPCEWIELLEQTECLDYVSPDVDACIEMQSRMEGDQELELTGTEFITSPAIPKLPSLVSLSVERNTNSMPMAQPQGTLPRRPGLREKFPRQQLLTDYTDAHYPHNYLLTVDRLVEDKQAMRVERSAERRSSERQSASRSLRFEVPQQINSSRPKRASWGGHSARANARAMSRRQCKSTRKSKDCMIPGCVKGARSRGLCKRHGGGKRCTFSGCARSDQGGGFCIAHGGGKRCATEGCKNSAQSRGRCKSHGGGKRCRAEGCAKSSQGGGFCRGHGAGRASKVKTANILL